MHRVCSVTLILALLSSVSDVWAYKAADYFPLPIGAYWTYQVDGGPIYEQTYVTGTRFINGIETVQLNSAGDVWSFTNDGNGLLLHAIETGNPNALVQFSPPIPLALADASIGDTLTSSGSASFYIPGQGTYPLSYSSTATIHQVQTISVPYGTFQTLRHTFSFTLTGTVAGQRINETTVSEFWLAEGIGVVRDNEGEYGLLELTESNIENLLKDPDGDGVLNPEDNCPDLANPSQSNNDGDSQGDACDTDDDNDGVPDTQDAFPFDASESADNDHDGIGDNLDSDDDNDDIPDTFESNFGLNPLSAADRNLDPDGDGFSNYWEYRGSSNPQIKASVPKSKPVTVALSGVIDYVHPDLVSGPFSLGQTIKAAYTYETNPALNQDLNPADTVGQYRARAPTQLWVDATPYQLDTDTWWIVTFGGPNNGIADGFDAEFSLLAPDISFFEPYIFRITLRDPDSTALPTDELPDQPPPLSEFESAALNIVYRTGAALRNITATVSYHQLIGTAPGDFDGDGTGNRNDAFPLDPLEQLDTDRDGIGNNADTDDDGDGLSDAAEAGLGTDPLRKDTDGDGMPDGEEIDEGLNPLDPNDCPAWFCGSSLKSLLLILQQLDRS